VAVLLAGLVSLSAPVVTVKVTVAWGVSLPPGVPGAVKV
jgi:hypothetical protein